MELDNLSPALSRHYTLPCWGQGQSKINVNVKGSGQECPLHTCNINCNFNVKDLRCWLRGSHFSQSTREMGHPSDELSDVLYLGGLHLRVGMLMLLFSHPVFMQRGRLSGVPAGLGRLFSAYPGLTHWAAFCRRFASGIW
jgi:hypothetical protein